MSYLFFFLSYFCLFKWCCCRSGHLSSKEAQIIFKAFRLPLSDDLQRALLEKYGQQSKTPIYYPRNISPQHILIFLHLMFASRFQDESEKIDYHAFLSSINWRENPAPAVLPDVTVKVSLKSSGWLSKKLSFVLSSNTYFEMSFFVFAKAATCTWECLCQGPGPGNLWAPQALSTSKPHLK